MTLHLCTGPDGEDADVPRHAFPDGVLAPWRLRELLAGGRVVELGAETADAPDPAPEAEAEPARPAARRKGR